MPLTCTILILNMEPSPELLSLPFINEYRSYDPYILSEEEKTFLKDKHVIYEEITKNYPLSLGEECSKKEREEWGEDPDMMPGFGEVEIFTENPIELPVENPDRIPNRMLTYGEIDYFSFGEIIHTCINRYAQLMRKGKFYDLGSGMGKATIAAALFYPFTHCIGIEALASLVEGSLVMKEEYDKLGCSNSEVTFIQGNLLEYDWSDACFVYTAATCFDSEMMIRLGDVPVQPGTIAVTLNKNLNREKWRTLEMVRKDTHWGYATVIIQIKL